MLQPRLTQLSCSGRWYYTDDSEFLSWHPLRAIPLTSTNYRRTYRRHGGQPLLGDRPLWTELQLLLLY